MPRDPKVVAAIELDALRVFVMDRPESLDVLTNRERSVAVGLLSEAPHQRRGWAELSQEFGLSERTVRAMWRMTRYKLERFKDQDPHKCPHCNGKGWIDAPRS